MSTPSGPYDPSARGALARSISGLFDAANKEPDTLSDLVTSLEATTLPAVPGVSDEALGSVTAELAAALEDARTGAISHERFVLELRLERLDRIRKYKQDPVPAATVPATPPAPPKDQPAKVGWNRELMDVLAVIMVVGALIALAMRCG